MSQQAQPSLPLCSPETTNYAHSLDETDYGGSLFSGFHSAIT